MIIYRFVCYHKYLLQEKAPKRKKKTKVVISDDDEEEEEEEDWHKLMRDPWYKVENPN